MSFLYSRKDVIKLMSNFDFTKTLLSGNKQYIDKITNDIAEKANNPDWNNLKNRPFYEEPTETSILSGTYEFEMWADFYGSTLPYTELTIGVIYDVIFDGITYSNLECRASENPDIKSYLGSSYDELLNDNHEYNFTIYQEVEFFTVYTTSTESSHSIEIIEKESTIKTLDSKYIPAEFVTETDLNTKQDIISISTLEGTTSDTTSLASGTVGTISSLKPSVAGTYLVLASARMGYTSGDESGAYNQKICLSTSTAFDNSTEASMTNIKSANATINCWAIMTLTASDTVYLLGYQSSGSAQTVDNERMYALKIA